MLRPRLIVNFAATVDGKVSTVNFTPTTFTSPEDKRRLLEIRALGDAVMVGRRTLENDQMTMGLPRAALRQARLARGQSEYPLRVIVSNSGALSPGLPVFGKKTGPILIFIAGDSPAAGSWPDDVHWHGGTNNLLSVLDVLVTRYQVGTVVCEGGPTLVRGLAESDLIDEIYLTIAPKMFGGQHAPTLLGTLDTYLPASRSFRLVELKVRGVEGFVHYQRER
ncbi:MAG TPA: RibD family protein [Chthoniobacterales bacterium]